jgi:hypothetical protein
MRCLIVAACLFVALLPALQAGESDKSPEAQQLFEDTAFAAGFGASWFYGSQFSISSERKEGTVCAYREIWPWQVHLIPEGNSAFTKLDPARLCWPSAQRMGLARL